MAISQATGVVAEDVHRPIVPSPVVVTNTADRLALLRHASDGTPITREVQDPLNCHEPMGGLRTRRGVSTIAITAFEH